MPAHLKQHASYSAMCKRTSLSLTTLRISKSEQNKPDKSSLDSYLLQVFSAEGLNKCSSENAIPGTAQALARCCMLAHRVTNQRQKNFVGFMGFVHSLCWAFPSLGLLWCISPVSSTSALVTCSCASVHRYDRQHRHSMLEGCTNSSAQTQHLICKSSDKAP